MFLVSENALWYLDFWNLIFIFLFEINVFVEYNGQSSFEKKIEHLSVLGLKCFHKNRRHSTSTENWIICAVTVHWVTQDKSLTQQFWQFPHLYYEDINSCKKRYWSDYLVKLIPYYYFSPWLTVSRWLLLMVWIRAPRCVTVQKRRVPLPAIMPSSFQNLVSMNALRNNDGVLPVLVCKEVFMPTVKAHEKGGSLCA